MRRSKLARIDPSLEEAFRESARKRIRNNVDRELRELPEMTRMVQNTPSFPKVMEELETIPKKEDLRRFG